MWRGLEARRRLAVARREAMTSTKRRARDAFEAVINIDSQSKGSYAVRDDC